MNTNIDEAVYALKDELIRVIVDSKLPSSILSMILHELYSDMKSISDDNVLKARRERMNQEAAEEVMEEDGEHTEVS